MEFIYLFIYLGEIREVKAMEVIRAKTGGGKGKRIAEAGIFICLNSSTPGDKYGHARNATLFTQHSHSHKGGAKVDDDNTYCLRKCHKLFISVPDTRKCSMQHIHHRNYSLCKRGLALAVDRATPPRSSRAHVSPLRVGSVLAAVGRMVCSLLDR